MIRTRIAGILAVTALLGAIAGTAVASESNVTAPTPFDPGWNYTGISGGALTSFLDHDPCPVGYHTTATHEWDSESQTWLHGYPAHPEFSDFSEYTEGEGYAVYCQED